MMTSNDTVTVLLCGVGGQGTMRLSAMHVA